MTHLRSARVLGTLFATALALTLTAAGPAPAAATGGGKPAGPAAVAGGAGTRSLPAGASACGSTRAKPSSAFAACRTAPAGAARASTATVSLPAGRAACASTAAKPSSGAAACAGGTAGAAVTPLVAFTLNLTASPTGLAPGGTSVLTATTNQDVGPTPFFIEIFDLTTGALVTECGIGTSCSAGVAQSASTVQNYVAYVSNFGTTNPPPGIQVTSNGVNVAWVTVAIEANTPALAPGGTVSLTATASLDVGPTPFFIEIFDENAGALVTECGFGSICSSNVTQGSTVRDYVAFVSGFGTTFLPPDIRAESAVIVVSWISVSLATDTLSLPAGGTANLTATASLDVGPTPFWIEIFDLTQNSEVTACGFSATCTAPVSQPSPALHAYIAFVANFGSTLPPPNVRAGSNTAFVSWL